MCQLTTTASWRYIWKGSWQQCRNNTHRFVWSVTFWHVHRIFLLCISTGHPSNWCVIWVIKVCQQNINMFNTILQKGCQKLFDTFPLYYIEHIYLFLIVWFSELREILLYRIAKFKNVVPKRVGMVIWHEH